MHTTHTHRRTTQGGGPLFISLVMCRLHRRLRGLRSGGRSQTEQGGGHAVSTARPAHAHTHTVRGRGREKSKQERKKEGGREREGHPLNWKSAVTDESELQAGRQWKKKKEAEEEGKKSEGRGELSNRVYIDSKDKREREKERKKEKERGGGGGVGGLRGEEDSGRGHRC